MNNFKVMMNGIIKENLTFVLLLGCRLYTSVAAVWVRYPATVPQTPDSRYCIPYYARTCVRKVFALYLLYLLYLSGCLQPPLCGR